MKRLLNALYFSFVYSCIFSVIVCLGYTIGMLIAAHTPWSFPHVMLALATVSFTSLAILYYRVNDHQHKAGGL